MNSVSLIGNLVREVETRATASGSTVGNMRIAVNDRKKQDGEWVDDPNYINIVVFGKSAESCARYLDKGSRVGIDGRLNWHAWETDDGQRRETLEVVANRVEFLTPPKQRDEEQSDAFVEEGMRVDEDPPVEGGSDDDIPF